MSLPLARASAGALRAGLSTHLHRPSGGSGSGSLKLIQSIRVPSGGSGSDGSSSSFHSLAMSVKSNAVNTGTSTSTTGSLYSTTSTVASKSLNNGTVQLETEIEENVTVAARINQDVKVPSDLDPSSFHPDGSASEQIVAGERSSVDPLAGKSRRGGLKESSSDHRGLRQGETEPNVNAKLNEKFEGLCTNEESSTLSKAERGRSPSLQDIDESAPIGP